MRAFNYIYAQLTNLIRVWLCVCVTVCIHAYARALRIKIKQTKHNKINTTSIMQKINQKKITIKNSIITQKTKGYTYKDIFKNLSICFTDPMHNIRQVRETIYQYNRYNLKQNEFQYDNRKILKFNNTAKTLVRVSTFKILFYLVAIFSKPKFIIHF
jgi:hypothetical protein